MLSLKALSITQPHGRSGRNVGEASDWQVVKDGRILFILPSACKTYKIRTGHGCDTGFASMHRWH